jgi:hypothetical protein
MAALTGYDEARVFRTQGACTGIRATLNLPGRYGVGKLNAATKANYYFNFYLGFGDVMEAGVSYSRKWSDAGSWRRFANGVNGQWLNKPLGLRSADSNDVSLELTVNANGLAEFRLGGEQAAFATFKTGAAEHQVKMCFAVCDVNNGVVYQVWYDAAAFTDLAVRTAAGDWLDPVASPKQWARIQWKQKLWPGANPQIKIPRVAHMQGKWKLEEFRTWISEPPMFLEATQVALDAGTKAILCGRELLGIP